VVVELGPGTGAVTEVLLQHLGKRSRFFALELDRNNTFLLRKRFPGCEIHNDSAENLRHHVNRCGPGGVDSVVSGLPWGNMGAGLQERILQAVVDVLAPGGRFATFAYIHTRWLPSARRFRRMLEDRFATVEQSRVVWRNLPPAVVYRCVQGGS
jgi:phospholipid N-methyltransferase